MNPIWTKIKNFLLDIIFPIECLGCRKEGAWLCQKCLDKFDLLDSFSCPFCGLKVKNGEICKSCRDKFVLDGMIIATSYNNEILKKAIHTLKYKFVPDIAEILGKFLTQAITKTNRFEPSEYKLIPIPLHKKRLLKRGFNQAEFLCQDLTKSFGLELLSGALKRKRQTDSQASLLKEQRIKNIQGAFVCIQPEKVKDKKIILIDDVFTTGSTIQEAAKVLKEAGCIEVWGLTLAHD